MTDDTPAVEEPTGDEGQITAEDGTVLPSRWHAYLVVEGIRSSDRRMFGEGALTWRDLPLALEWNPQGSDHWDAGIVGSIETVERDAQGRIYAEGSFDLGSPIGREAARLNAKKLLRWVSIDAEVFESEVVGYDPWDDMFFFWETRNRKGFEKMAEDDWYELYTSARIAGCHMVTMPCFPQAVICPIDEELPDVEDDLKLPTEPADSNTPDALAACGSVAAPPAAWFADPELDTATPVTVLSSGRVFGHLATWGTCHIGFEDACVCPPHSERSYAYAMTGRILTAEATHVPVGHLTLGTGHAPLQASHHAAAAHYDDTGTVVADVAFGEDAVGIWFAGALRPGATEEQVFALRASAISGDWRTIGGNLELVAALCVNVPGFPITASAVGPLNATMSAPRAGMRREASGARRQVSLVAAGIARPDPSSPAQEAIQALERKVDQLSAVIRPLIKASTEALIARVEA